MVGIIVNKIGHITTIGINRPNKRNCFNSETAIFMQTALDDFEKDINSYAAVLYGLGGNFCSGFDLEELSTIKEETEFSKMVDGGLMVSI